MTDSTSVIERRFDIDWLRTLAMLTVFLFHCARYFDHEGWHVKNPTLDYGMTLFVGFVVLWIMPLFFILSAISASFSLNRHSGLQFIKSRATRLLIPLIVGMLTHISLQVYIERVSHSQFDGSFFSFYPQYFKGFYAFGGNFAWMGLHLWYLEILFIFSLIALPLLLLIKKKPFPKITKFLNKPGAIYLLAIPVFLMEIIAGLDPEGMGRRDFGGWPLLSYLAFFIIGYVVAQDDGIKMSMERHRWLSLVLGVITVVLLLVIIRSDRPFNGIVFTCIRAFSSWFWLAAFLGMGSRYLRVKNRFLIYANEAVLPFYILHQTVIVVIAFLILTWPAGILVKYSFLAFSSFVMIVILYEFFIRRINILRFLFGMKNISFAVKE